MWWVRHRTDGYLKSGAQLACCWNRNWLKAERWKGLLPWHKMSTTEPGARPQHLTISVPPYRALHPCSAPGSLLTSALGWFTLPWRHPGVKATWLLHPHRCSSSSTCPSSAVCSGMRMRRFWPFSHLKCFAPWSRIQEIMCSSLYRVCQWWRPSCSTPSQWMDLQDSFFSIEFLSLSKESEV